MKNRQILWAIVFGSMLAITGCGDSGGSGGSTGTGGSNGGPASSTCEAFCNSTCVYMGVDPEGQQCLTNCQVGIPQFDDECGSQADALVECLESVNCEPSENDCVSQGTAWGTCIAGVFQ